MPTFFYVCVIFHQLAYLGNREAAPAENKWGGELEIFSQNIQGF